MGMVAAIGSAQGAARHGSSRNGGLAMDRPNADIACNTVANQLRLMLPQRALLLPFAPRLDMVAWTLEAVEAKR